MNLTKILLALALFAAGLVTPLTASALCSGANSIQQAGCTSIPRPQGDV